jgi:hypothetical protein
MILDYLYDNDVLAPIASSCMVNAAPHLSYRYATLVSITSYGNGVELKTRRYKDDKELNTCRLYN